jgi:predicted CoA-binding protein
MTTEQRIKDFMAQKRVAVVGVSRKQKALSGNLFHDLWKHGYDAVPVNPNTTEYGGLPCLPRVQNIVPPVGAALIMTSAAHARTVIHDCAEAGIKRVWVHLGAGKHPLSPEDVAFCKDNGIQVIIGYCPYMFLGKPAFPHNLHGWIARLSKDYRTKE